MFIYSIATTYFALMQHLMAEFSNSLHGGGWVHSVSFSSDGNRLAWVGHDSSLSVADATRGMAIYKLKTAYLPLLVRYITVLFSAGKLSIFSILLEK